MRVVLFDRYGDSGVLAIREVPLPTAGVGEVLVRVRASGVNPKDAMVRSGALRMFTGRQFPRGTGFDFAGEVAVPGAGVADLPVGQRVWGFLDGFMGGAAAEYLVAPRGWLSPMPERLDWAEAAAIPLVHQPRCRRSGMSPGWSRGSGCSSGERAVASAARRSRSARGCAPISPRLLRAPDCPTVWSSGRCSRGLRFGVEGDGSRWRSVFRPICSPRCRGSFHRSGCRDSGSSR